MTRISVGLRFGYGDRPAPICPFTLQDADHARGIGGQSCHSVETAVTASPDMFPDLIWMLKLEQGHAEVLEGAGSHEVRKPSLHFNRV